MSVLDVFMGSFLGIFIWIGLVVLIAGEVSPERT